MSISYTGINALVMGLGLSGGGLETAKFLLERGARVTVTDLKTEAALAPSVDELKRFAAEHGYPPVRFVLSGHEMRDFETADMVVKNPIVHPDSPYLLCAKRVESDIGLFLAECPARLTAVTGSKGKSTVTAAIHFVLDRAHAQRGSTAWLGGNSARSPLAFAGRLKSGDDVTLELSSWQLGDLRGKTGADGEPLLKPRVAVITAIFSDHQNWYQGMAPYIADKRVIFAGQDEADATITLDDEWGRRFLQETRAKKISTAVIPPELQGLRPKIPGAHQRLNLLLAGLALHELLDETAGENTDGKTGGLSFIRESLEAFPGVEHRLECFFETVNEGGGIRFYNDSAATVPEAAAEAAAAFDSPVLIAGGTDKALDFTPLAAAAAGVRSLILLAGSGTDKLIPLLEARKVSWQGPFTTLDAAVRAAYQAARAGGAVVFSPGCTSFEMFENEFDRGRKFKDAVRALCDRFAGGET